MTDPPSTLLLTSLGCKKTTGRVAEALSENGIVVSRGNPMRAVDAPLAIHAPAMVPAYVARQSRGSRPPRRFSSQRDLIPA